MASSSACTSYTWKSVVWNGLLSAACPGCIRVVGLSLDTAVSWPAAERACSTFRLQSTSIFPRDMQMTSLLFLPFHWCIFQIRLLLVTWLSLHTMPSYACVTVNFTKSELESRKIPFESIFLQWVIVFYNSKGTFMIMYSKSQSLENRKSINVNEWRNLKSCKLIVPRRRLLCVCLFVRLLVCVSSFHHWLLQSSSFLLLVVVGPLGKSKAELWNDALLLRGESEKRKQLGRREPWHFISSLRVFRRAKIGSAPSTEDRDNLLWLLST